MSDHDYPMLVEVLTKERDELKAKLKDRDLRLRGVVMWLSNGCSASDKAAALRLCDLRRKARIE